MKANNTDYNHKHGADFFVLRPNGLGDNLLFSTLFKAKRTR